jgi:hypothetical protein
MLPSVCVSLSAIRCNSNLLHVKLPGNQGSDKEREILSIF